jgi:tetratricopeptide (TPR) repeat protein
MNFNEDDDDENDEGGYGDSYLPMHEILRMFAKAKLGEQINLQEEEFEILIEFFVADNDKKSVDLAFELATNLYPFSSSLLLLKAEWLLDQTKMQQALKVLDDAELIDPNNLEALLLRIEILEDTNRHEEAIAYCLEVLPNFGKEDSCQILLEVSELYDSLEEYEKVYNTLFDVLKKDPVHEETLMRICFWTDLCNKQQQSIEHYVKVLEDNPFSVLVWYNIGAAYQGLHLYEKAIESYTTCLDLDDTHEYAMRNMGDCYMKLRQYNNAIEILEKHVSLGNPEDAILEALGQCWEKLKNYPKARKFYRQVIEIAPQDDSIFSKIGNTYKKEHQWLKAFKSYDTAHKMDKLNIHYTLDMATCLQEMKMYEESILVLSHAMQINPTSKSVWQLLITAMYKNNLLDTALEGVVNARDIVGEKTEWTYYEAAILLRQGKTKQAVLLLENALHENVKKLAVLKQLDEDVVQHPIFANSIAMFKKQN